MIDIDPNTTRYEGSENSCPTLGDLPIPSEENRLLLDQVDRILRSEELHGSEVLRRLLRFLAAKSVLGEADDLKEYSIATDGLGKPCSYDPRQNSAVRIQVGRLRQKLADYYRQEGEHDPLLIDIPKGRFKLHYEPRCEAAEKSAPAAPESTEHAEQAQEPRSQPRLKRMRLPAAVAAGILIAIALGALYNGMKPAKANATAVAYPANWNLSMEELWRPFIATDRPMIVAIEDPLFVELDGKKGVYFRDKTLNNWDQITSSPAVQSLRTELKYHDIAPSRYYTAFGEVDASFLLAKALGSRVQNLSIIRTSDISMRELSGNNVVFVGLQNLFFTEQIQAAPIEIPLEQVFDGIRNVHPGPGEPAVFLDDYSTAPTEQGIAYALVTHVPGPLAGNEVESFTCSRAAGYVAAVKAFTDPAFVRDLVGRLKQIAGGRIPRYYQVLLKVRFKAEVPTEITYVLAKELRYRGHP